MCLGGPSITNAPAPPKPVTEDDPDVVASRNNARMRAAQARGRAATILTGGSGVAGKPTTITGNKTFLGQ